MKLNLRLNVYSGPDRSTPIIGVLNPRAKVVLEARNIDTVWIVGHSTDGTVRGWMDSRFLEFAPAVSIPKLLVSNETMFVTAAATSNGTYHSIDLAVYTVIPVSMGRARDVFQAGRVHDRDPNVVSKIGDCISDNRYFLSPFGWNQYKLGSYEQLAGVLNHFSGSLAYDSLAAYDGLVTTAVLDPVLANRPEHRLRVWRAAPQPHCPT